MGNRYYFLGHRSTDKTYTREKRLNEQLVGRCITIPSGPGLSIYSGTSVKLLLTSFVELVMFGSHVRQSSIQGTHKRMVRLQKLTRNLFLTLRCHNVHRQQRQLSKFLMRYSSSLLMLTAGPVSKMAL